MPTVKPDILVGVNVAEALDALAVLVDAAPPAIVIEPVEIAAVVALDKVTVDVPIAEM
jgi:hypothetical protein